MNRPVLSLIAPAALTLALVAMPAGISAYAAGGGGGDVSEAMSGKPAQPAASSPTDGTTKRTQKSKKAKQSFLDAPAFKSGYRSAHATIYQQHDYARAIAQLRALGHDDDANVANLIGYAWRKLGDYKLSQAWYERALKADPNHVLTWQYYGLWQLEQGNREQAQYHLTRIAQICGTACEHYRSLDAALAQAPGTGLVY